MENVLLFPFAEYWWFYAAFTAFILVMLALDLGVFHRDAHEVSFKEAATWSAVWMTLAVAFAGVLYWYAGSTFPADARLMAVPGFDPQAAAKQVTLEYLTGLIVEKSLAVDNIFVFVVVFTFFAVPPIYQHRVLFYGILGALLFRVIFIALGSVLLKYHAIVIFFGLFLIATGIKIIFAPEKPMDPEKNPVIKLLRKILPITPAFEGQKFLVRKDGRWWGTPLLVALVVIEVSDIIFAVDSVPAIFALTKEPLIVFTSNVFAILGLRAMYFLLAGVVSKFRLLKYGLGLVLVFVGLKMAWLNEAFGGKFPITWSLGIITLLVGGSIAASLLIPERKQPAA
ncbi:MAG TPA: TerC family protein [Gemmatimonadales bacterium]